MPLYETQKGFNRQGAGAIQAAFAIGLITDAIINPLTTVAGLRALTFSGYETSKRLQERFQYHVDRLEGIGILTDAAVAAADTVAGLMALLTAEDSAVSLSANLSLVA